jgi:hypothetical protein
MTNCAKCGAELIGSRKFCAACGAPTDPSSLKRADPLGANSSGPASSPVPAPGPQINVPSTAYGPPLAPGAPPVNPFAATASPASRAMGSPYGPPPATTSNPPSGAPPGAPGSMDGTAPVPPVSPLAVSNALSQRGAYQNVAGDRIPPSAPSSSKTGPSAPGPRTGTSPPPPPAGGAPASIAKKAPGTQLMPSMPNPGAFGPRSGSSPPGSNPAASQPKPPPQRTQMMDAASFSRPNPASAQPAPQPPAPAAPPVPAVPPSVMHQPQPPPHQWGGGGGGWGAPAAPHAGYGGFGFAPGARVNVTWSNGQRYPATVSQVSGTQCLVVFPDGQQHWVEMQYVTPG